MQTQVLKRFNHDEALEKDAEDAEDQGVVNAAKESASEYASEAVEKVGESYEAAKESIAAAGASALGQAPDYMRPLGPRTLTPTPSLYVGNILFDITAADLEREFGQFGNILSTVVVTDSRGLSKGYFPSPLIIHTQ